MITPDQQISHQVNKIFCLSTLCAWVFFSTLLPWDFVYAKRYNITISKNFPEPTIQFHDFPGLENEILQFHDPYEP